MSKINSIANGTYTIGQTSATNFVAGPGISITEPSAGTVRISNDETVLWSGTLRLNNQATLSEKPTNFDRLRFYWADWNSSLCTHVSECSPNYTTSSNYALNGTWYGAASSTITLFDLKLVDDFDKTITFKYGTFKNLTGSTVSQANESKITKIVGVNRISGSNA